MSEELFPSTLYGSNVNQILSFIFPPDQFLPYKIFLEGNGNGFISEFSANIGENLINGEEG